MAVIIARLPLISDTDSLGIPQNLYLVVRLWNILAAQLNIRSYDVSKF